MLFTKIEQQRIKASSTWTFIYFFENHHYLFSVDEIVRVSDFMLFYGP